MIDIVRSRAEDHVCRVVFSGQVWFLSDTVASVRVTRLRDKLEGCKTVIIWSQAPYVCRSAS